MSTLTEKLISILERDRRGLDKDPGAEVPNSSIDISRPRYPVGTVFVKTGAYGDRAAILVRYEKNKCMLISLPYGNRWSDDHVFLIQPSDDGPTKEEFHRAFGDIWEVSRRGKEALEEWARTDV